jgi:hypothetical protein
MKTTMMLLILCVMFFCTSCESPVTPVEEPIATTWFKPTYDALMEWWWAEPNLRFQNGQIIQWSDVPGDRINQLIIEVSPPHNLEVLQAHLQARLPDHKITITPLDTSYVVWSAKLVVH